MPDFEAILHEVPLLIS